MKILLSTYSSAFLTSGGGESEMVQVAELLTQNGCQADIYGIGSRPLQYYDALMHFSVESDGASLLRVARSHGKKVFLWPNVWWHKALSPDESSSVREFISMATCLLFKSETEKTHFFEHIGPVDQQSYVVPAVVPDVFLQQPDLALLQVISDLKHYALCIGLIEPIKNQLPLIHALNDLGLPGMFVGGVRDEHYNETCLRDAGPNMKFLPYLQPCSTLLRSAIAHAQLIVEPSFDPPGRSCLEGALMRKPLVVLDTPWAREHFADAPYYAKGSDAAAIGAAIKSALEDVRKNDRVEQTHRRVLAKHTGSNGNQALINVLIKERS